MIEFTSRITPLIARLEAGDELTPEDGKRITQLQALDIAKTCEDYVKVWMEQEARTTEDLKQLMEA